MVFKSYRLFFLILISFLTQYGCQTTSESQVLHSEKGIIVSYINSGELGIAMRRLRAAIEKYPREAELLNLMGLVQLALENPESALKYFESSKKIETKPSVELNMSSALIELGRYKEARTILSKLITDLSKSSYNYPERLYHNMAYSFQKEGKFDSAIKYYQQAITKNPTYHMSWLNLGRAFEANKNSLKAQESYDKAKFNCRGCYEPVAALVDFYQKNNKIEKSIEELNEFLKIETVDVNSANAARTKLSQISNIAANK